MKSISLAIITLLMTITLLSAQKPFTDKEFNKEWSKVDSLSNLGQPKSALETLNSLYVQAKKDNNNPQIIKSIIYRIKLHSDFREDALVRSIYDLKKEVYEAKPPVKQVLSSMLAELYQQYYQINKWRFNDRSTLSKTESDSINTWDLNTISSEITRTYLASLEDETLLKTIPIGNYEPILLNPDQENRDRKTKSFKPFLYDFLAWRALDYFTAKPELKNQPSNRFRLTDTRNFLPGGEWMMLPEVKPDSASPESFSMILFRKLTALHLTDKDQRALIDIELARLAFVHREGSFADKDSLYIIALANLESKYPDSPWSTDISVVLATFLIQQGNMFNPISGDNHKWQIKEAKNICEKAISKYPDSEGAIICKNLLRQLLQKIINLTVESVIPDKPFLGSITWKNADKMWFRIVKTNPETIGDVTAGMSEDERKKYFLSLPVLKSWTINLPADGDFQNHTSDIEITGLKIGHYHLVAMTGENTKDSSLVIAEARFYVSNISYINKPDNIAGLYLYILNRETGKPIKGATVEAFVKKYDKSSRKYESLKTGTFTSDEDGFLKIPAPSGEDRYGFFLKISDKSDFLITNSYYIYKDYQRVEKERLTTTFFTDRSIYRPGQTVYFKGIVLRNKDKIKEIAAGVSISVTFLDANSQKVSDKSFMTNEFGSFNGSFVIPSSGLIGRFSISTSTGSVAFAVEEYKRPTFETEFSPVKGNFRLNDSINITGKASGYAGNAITGSTVKFRVVRTARFPFWERWWMPFPSSPEVEITNGTSTTGVDGAFSFTFFALPDLSIDDRTNPVFDFRFYADVTDLNGETRQAEGNVSVGNTSLVINLSIPGKVNIKTDSAFVLISENLNGQKTPLEISLTVHRLKQPDRILRKRNLDQPDMFIIPENIFKEKFPDDIYKDEAVVEKWNVENTLLQKTYNTATDTLFHLQKEVKDILPGVYRVILKSTDPFGKPVTTTKHFVLFDPESKKIPVNETSWFVQLNNTVEPGENASFLVGTGEKDVNMIYEIYFGDSLFSRQWVNISNEQRKIIIPVKEEFRGNFSVNFAFIKKNRAYQSSAIVIVPFTNKKLDIRFETFRSKLVPGDKEEWKIKIADISGKGVNAEFLASMYDASLDIFTNHSWWFDVYSYRSGNYAWQIDFAFSTNSGTGYSKLVQSDVHSRSYDELNWFGFGYFGRRGRYSKGESDNVLFSIAEEKSISKGEASPSQTNETDPEVLGQTAVTGGKDQQQIKQVIPVKPRTDFRETAFFYPEMVTDAEGNLILKFSAPESLTEWKMMGLAHTKDLKTAYITKELVTRKDLMVFPNSPRFVRQGDTTVFSVKVVNMSNRALSGEVALELTNPVTGQPVELIFAEGKKSDKNSQNFTLTAGESKAYNWNLIISSDASLSMMQYKVTARSGNFSDGEEKAIPVLTNRMMVTESLPLPVRGAGSFDFKMEKLTKSVEGKSLKNYRLTLEFASNPVWYAIQALPSLDNPKYPSADGIFNAFYANSIASHIANSSPRIQKVFESWKSITPEALLSNLEKNQELKSAVLQETPWVMDANDESQRKQRLGQLFDLNTIASRLGENISKLQKLQKSEGGWSWFEGMPSSRFITQQIVTGFGHLDHLGVKNIRNDQITWNIVTNAVIFLDNELVREYDWLKKHNKDYQNENHLSGMTVQYLYARSYFLKEFPVGKEIKEAFDFYKKQAEKYWLKNDIYLQGMIGLALNRLGNKEIPGLIIKSLSEKALHSKEMGMYWASNSGYYWYEAPVETHALLIEAFEEITADKASVNEMKIWLLKQKQTTDWRTGRATAEACYALLLRGEDLLSQDQNATFKIGGITVDPNKFTDQNSEAGTGYFKMSWSGDEIQPGMGNVQVTKTGEGVAWGAMYWQYFEDLDKITPAQTPLKLGKKVFIERNTASGPVLDEISASSVLKTGDKLKVRIILTADRELDYVHLKDMRASAFEPAVSATISGYRYQDGLGYYQSTTDAATNFFFDHLSKGTYVFEYSLIVNAAGNYSNGITTVQCMYAPEFGAHSEGIRVEVTR